MFRDELTGQQSEPKQKPTRIVTKTRPKTYYGDRMNAETKKLETVVIGTGFEIVEEKSVLPATAAQFYQGSLNGKIENKQANETPRRFGQSLASGIKALKKV